MASGNIQLEDIAKELGLSTSTVSRAISGKGHLSEATRNKVKDCVEKYGYYPNANARSLAKSKTNNICVIIPTEAFLYITPYYQVCLMGIIQQTAKHNYNALVTTVSENDNSYLKRVIATQLVDGVILTRSMTNDETLLYLRNNQIPFVIIGSQEDKTIPQVDGNHIKASRELTKTLLDKSASVAILLGGTNYMVNENRYKGYAEAYKDKGITLDSNIVYTNLIAPEQIEKAIDNLYTYNVKTVICGDDNLCMQALNHLAKRGISIPWQIKVASLYDSPLLSNRTPPITAVEIDDRKLGALAAETLINLIEGNETSESNKTPDYQIHYRLSTELI